ncbi:porin family protein [Starkeya sp. ORNL1]|uniref:outer membrane protein n=1 Tax=Starkeya sp. ORNL1 TaxID=2709380 RepID=UPI0014647DCF|nr:outer membrane protein [Starkeya sp. ORNL1]QJP16343.1 porin family protein [Starkeya sp. ORNL1]
MHKRLLVANVLAAVLSVGAAHAADLPLKAAPPVVAPAFSWTGFYIGAHGGYGWGRNEWSNYVDPINGTTVDGPDAEYDIEGGLAGGQIGFNWQINQFVLGVEADASWADINGKGKYSDDTCLLSNDACETKIDALGTITARLGAAFDRALFYVKGGAAWAHTEYHAGYTQPDDPGFNFSDQPNETRWGWTIGAGAEYAFADNWSVKIEYNYIELGDDRIEFDYSPQTFGASGEADQHLSIVKAGINYRF